MADKVIDLTGSPPSPSRSLRFQRIIRSRALSARRIQSRRAHRALCLNRNRCYINQRMAPWVPRRLFTLINCALSRVANSFRANIHDGQVQAAATNVPVTEPDSASIYRHGSNLNEAWTPKEHENMDQPSTYSYSCRNMDQIYAAIIVAYLISKNENLMGASDLFSNRMKPNKPQPKEAPFFSVPPVEEGNDSTHGFKKQTSDGSTLMTAGDEDDLDLELSLG